MLCKRGVLCLAASHIQLLHLPHFPLSSPPPSPCLSSDDVLHHLLRLQRPSPGDMLCERGVLRLAVSDIQLLLPHFPPFIPSSFPLPLV